MPDNKLYPGMLILGQTIEKPGEPLDCLWTVSSATRLICYREGIQVKATLRKSELPPGWRIVANAAVVELLTTNGGSQ